MVINCFLKPSSYYNMEMFNILETVLALGWTELQNAGWKLELKDAVM